MSEIKTENIKEKEKKIIKTPKVDLGTNYPEFVKIEKMIMRMASKYQKKDYLGCVENALKIQKLNLSDNPYKDTDAWDKQHDTAEAFLEYIARTFMRNAERCLDEAISEVEKDVPNNGSITNLLNSVAYYLLIAKRTGKVNSAKVSNMERKCEEIRTGRMRAKIELEKREKKFRELCGAAKVRLDLAKFLLERNMLDENFDKIMKEAKKFIKSASDYGDTRKLKNTYKNIDKKAKIEREAKTPAPRK